MLNDSAGWARLKALPFSRRKRKQLMTASWIVNLSAGPSDGTAEFKVLEDGSVMAEIDIVRPRAFGLPGIMGSGYWKDKGHAGVSAGSGRDG